MSAIDYFNNSISPGDRILRYCFSTLDEYVVTRVTKHSIYVENYQYNWVSTPNGYTHVKSPKEGEKRFSIKEWGHRIINLSKITIND